MNVLVFDLETVPDVAAGRRLLNLPDAPPEDVVAALETVRFEQTGHRFLAHPLHRIVACSVVLRTANEAPRVWSLGDPDSPESEILARFFEGLRRYSPVLVSWNGNGFDLPVIQYRALRHGVPSPRYWDQGEFETGARYDNYLNRYHQRHLDLMDRLSGFQSRAVAPLDQVATLLGFPGKLGMSGGQVWARFQAGDIDGIRHYCETDVLNTYLVYLRFQLIRGHLSRTDYHDECQALRTLLHREAAAGRSHLGDFESAWLDDGDVIPQPEPSA